MGFNSADPMKQRWHLESNEGQSGHGSAFALRVLQTLKSLKLALDPKLAFAIAVDLAT